MRYVALQNRRGTTDVSLTFKSPKVVPDDQTGFIPDFHNTENGLEIARVLNLAIRDYNRGKVWLEGVPTKPGIYIVEMDNEFSLVRLHPSTGFETWDNEPIGNITRYLRVRDV